MSRDDLRLCDGCMTMKPAVSFAVGCGNYCADCRQPARITPDGERVERRTEVRDQKSAVSEETTMAKRECPWCHEPKANLYEHAKVCKQRPEGAVLELKRPRRGRKGKKSEGRGQRSAETKSTALALRKSAAIALPRPARTIGESVDDVRGRMAAALADLQTALRVLDQYAGARG